MPKRFQPLLVPAVIAAGAVLAASIATVLWVRPSSPPSRSSAAREGPDPELELERLEGQLRRQEEVLAALLARMAEMDGRLGRLAAEQRAVREPAAEAPELEASTADPPSSSPWRLEAAARWLESLFPERFAGLLPGEAEHLRDLDLREAEIADDDLGHLGELSSLRSLSLRGTAVTDDGLARLRGLEQLQTLELRGTKVAGAGLQHLPSSIEELDLTDTRLSEDTLPHLPRLPLLKSLDLNRLPIGDAAVEVLGRYPSLRKVELDGTGITDDGLRRLLELNPALERVELRGARTTAEAMKELAGAYPKLTIVQQ